MLQSCAAQPPTRHVPSGRAVEHAGSAPPVGDVVIELHRTRWAVDDAGYGGRIKVEIFYEGLWALSVEEALKLVSARYVMHGADDEVSS